MKKQERLIASLKQLGLEEKEIKVYLAALKTGIAPASKIAQESGYKRTTSYDILNGLKIKGWVHISFLGNRQYWAARDPNQLLTNFKRQIKKFESFIPGLKTLKSKKPKIKVQFFEGIEGMKTATASFIPKFTRNTTYYIVSSSTHLFALDFDYWLGYIRERAQKNVKTKMIGPRSKANLKMAGNPKLLYTVKFLPKKNKFSGGGIIIYKDWLLINSPREIISILIESSELTWLLRDIFNFLWQSL